MLTDHKRGADLRMVAEHVGLAPCSVSAILNDTPAAKAIPQTTKDRVRRAAAMLNYRPNFWARSLRTKRTRMVAAVTHDFGHGAAAQVVAGVQSRLQREGYLLALATLDFANANHRPSQFQQRGIEGVIAIDATMPSQFGLPIACVELGTQPFKENMRVWLTAMGESAAETIIQQIENPGTSRKMKVEPKLPPAYFELSNRVDAAARETA